MADAVRVIEYQVLPWSELDGMGDLPRLLKDALGEQREVGILRCVHNGSRKVTFAGSADATMEMVRNGGAGNPSGVMIPKTHFPVMVTGWPDRLDRGHDAIIV